MNQGPNDPQTIGWLVIAVFIGVLIYLTAWLVIDVLARIRERKADNHIFRAVEEARSDFSKGIK